MVSSALGRAAGGKADTRSSSRRHAPPQHGHTRDVDVGPAQVLPFFSRHSRVDVWVDLSVQAAVGKYSEESREQIILYEYDKDLVTVTVPWSK